MPKVNLSDETIQNLKSVIDDKPQEGEALRIAIVDNRGLTFVGHMSLKGDGEWITIRGARCIVYWGTTKHLAELVDGPTSKTKFGVRKTVTVRRENIVAVYDCCGGWDE